MRVDELTTTPKPLLEGFNLQVYEALLPLLLINEDDAPGDGTTPPDVTPPTPPVQPPGGGGWYHGPFRPDGGMNGNHWINQFYFVLKNLAISKNILKRMKQLGIKGAGQKRVKLAAKIAAKHVKLMLKNPGATAYRLGGWTTSVPVNPMVKKWNEAFAIEFEKQLALMEENDLTLHDYKKGEIVTVIDSPKTRGLHGKKLKVIKQIDKIDGKYVRVETERNADGLGVEADVKVTMIDSVK